MAIHCMILKIILNELEFYCKEFDPNVIAVLGRFLWSFMAEMTSPSVDFLKDIVFGKFLWIALQPWT